VTYVKYSNKSSLCAEGHSHRSKLESAVCQLLSLRKRAKEIISFEAESTVKLTRAGIRYIADFRCLTPGGDALFVEAKGVETPEWRLKLKLWRFYGPGPLEIWKGTHLRPYLHETVIPEIEK